MASLTSALQELRAERSRAQLHVEELDQAISVIESLNGSKKNIPENKPTKANYIGSFAAEVKTSRRLLITSQQGPGPET